jgi:hypothetical protein
MHKYVLCHLLNVNDQIDSSLIIVLVKLVLCYIGSL